jgi:hypothetical protein
MVRETHCGGSGGGSGGYEGKREMKTRGRGGQLRPLGRGERKEGRKEGRCLLTATVRLGLVEVAPSTSGTAAAAMTVIVAAV